MDKKPITIITHRKIKDSMKTVQLNGGACTELDVPQNDRKKTPPEISSTVT